MTTAVVLRYPKRTRCANALLFRSQKPFKGAVTFRNNDVKWYWCRQTQAAATTSAIYLSPHRRRAEHRCTDLMDAKLGTLEHVAS